MSSLSRECFNQLYQNGSIIDIPKGHNFAIESRGTHYIYCLQSGICGLARYTESGKEIIYHYFQEGSVLGVGRFNLLQNRQDQMIKHGVNYTLVAKTNCIMSKLTFEKASDLIAINPEIGKLFDFCVSDYYFSILNHIHSSHESCASIRLYRLLIHLAIYKEGVYMIDKHFTYVEMAKYLSVHYVTVSRLMAELKQNGIISKLGHNTIITDMAALEILADSTDTL